MSAMPGNPQNRSTFQRRSDSPRKVRGGIKLTGTLKREPGEAANAGVELARRFQALWETIVEPEALNQGLDYARSGQIVDIDFRSGLVEAHVQGTLPRPYLVQLHIPVFDAEQWSRAIQAMSGEAVYVAKLLTGEMPGPIHERLKQSGVELLPTSAEGLGATCTCAAATSKPDDTNARCKHVAAAASIAAEKLAEQPLLIFPLLGLSPEQLLEQLRHARAGHSGREATAAMDLMLHDSTFHAPPLEACVEDFWRSSVRGEDWNRLFDPVSSHYVPHALLRRLGPSPLNGRFPLVGLLASVYDAVSAAARQIHEQGSRFTDTDPSR